jgi:autotransporter-associated beta strand protein
LFFTGTGALVMVPGGAATLRTLSLSGTYPLNNGLDSIVADAADGGPVGLTKSGPGIWNVHGDNTYSGPTLVQQSPGTSAGTLRITGDLYLDASSDLVIEIFGDAAGKYDRLEVVGTAALGGTLRVELPNQVGGPYVPQLGDQFAFLSVQGGAGGMFDNRDLPALASGLAWEVNPGGVTLFLDVVAALPGDYNFSGVVDAADYTVWRDSLGQMATGLAADGDRDGVVDQDDYGVWKSQFGVTLSGGGQAAADAAAVPEPACGVLGGLMIFGLVSVRRRNAVRR